MRGTLGKGALITPILGIVWIVVSMSVVAAAEWQAIWYDMSHPGEYDLDQILARTTFPFHISEDWGSETVLDSSPLLRPSSGEHRADKVGFQAECEVFITSADVYRIVIVANNGIVLHVDDEVVVHSWDNVLPDGGGTRSISAEVRLDVGCHSFELWYYEWEGTALLYFDSNISPLGFERTATRLDEALNERQDSENATPD